MFKKKAPSAVGEPKKNWFLRHKIISSILAIYALGIVVTAFSNKEEVKTKVEEVKPIEQVQAEKPVEVKLPEYILIGQERRGLNADGVFLVHIYLPNGATEEEIINLNAKLVKDVNIQKYKSADIRYFDNRLAAQTYSDKVILSEREVERFFDDWIYNFVSDSTASKVERLEKQVNGEWITIKTFEPK